MSSFNLVILMGNLTRDVELRFSPKGTAVGKFGLALNRKWTSETGEKKEEVTFVDCDVFGKTAENLAQYCKKGAAIHLQGRLKFDVWDDKSTGQKRSKLAVVAETIQFLGSKAETAAAPRANAPAPATNKDEPPHEGDDVPF